MPLFLSSGWNRPAAMWTEKPVLHMVVLLLKRNKLLSAQESKDDWHGILAPILLPTEDAQ